ncbi:MAG TPA: HlyD family efflux transporter periplasmic adaptor subunit [Caulobacteraceae bacterium]|jgi:membrane fusion protein (multidrug efflux system)
MADDHAGPPPAADRTKPSPTAAAADDARKKAARKRLFGLLGLGLVGAVVLYGLYYFLVASHFVSTDDAYVGADVAQVTPLVSGPVKAVHVADTQAVKAGDVLVEIDPADATLAVARADADYQRAVRTVKGDLATQDALSAQVGARGADVGRAKANVEAAKADVAKAKLDYDRRQALANSGAVSGEELTSAKTAYTNAQSAQAGAEAALAQANATQKASESQLAAQEVMTQGTVDANPQVAAARAALNTAKLDLERATVRAPIDGVVTRRQVQVGQRVQVGTPLMTLVPTAQVYVDANFKEAQLRKVQVGQCVTMESDLYGGGVKYHGKVIGLSGGTGSAFALIPAQNATGNWIKVVQRLPVRVQLRPDELAQHPLRVGLSIKAKIDLSCKE